MLGPTPIGELQTDLNISNKKFSTIVFDCEHVKQGIRNDGKYCLYLSSNFELIKPEVTSSESFDILLEDKDASTDKIQLTLDGKKIKT